MQGSHDPFDRIVEERRAHPHLLTKTEFVGVIKEGLELLDRLAFVVKNRPARADPARTDCGPAFDDRAIDIADDGSFELRFGPAREQQESWQRMMQALARSTQAQLQVSTQWNEIIGRALRELAERLTPRLKSGAPPESMKEVYDLWVDTAESVYAQAARGGSFVQAQAELTNATSQLRSAQRELLEEWARQFDLPTRAELNSIHQQLRELKAALLAAGPRGAA